MNRCHIRRALVALAATALVAGCGSDGGAIEISDAWVRTSPSMASAGAAYMEVSNTGDSDDALIGAAVDPGIAATVEIHETVTMDSDDGGMGSDTTMGDMGTDTTMEGGGMMTMQPVERIDIPAGGSVSLEPGGYHVMFLDLAAPFEAGDSIEITLTFENAGEQVVTAEVRDANP